MTAARRAPPGCGRGRRGRRLRPGGGDSTRSLRGQCSSSSWRGPRCCIGASRGCASAWSIAAAGGGCPRHRRWVASRDGISGKSSQSDTTPVDELIWRPSQSEPLPDHVKGTRRWWYAARRMSAPLSLPFSYEDACIHVTIRLQAHGLAFS